MRRLLLVLAVAACAVGATAGQAQAAPPPSLHKTGIHMIAPSNIHKT